MVSFNFYQSVYFISVNCQLEKMNSNAFDVMYDYCPLDLFSGDIQRMRSALNSLILVPHRNLRIFFNGTVIHSDELSLNHQSLQDTLFHGGSVTIEELVTAVCFPNILFFNQFFQNNFYFLLYSLHLRHILLYRIIFHFPFKFLHFSG